MIDATQLPPEARLTLNQEATADENGIRITIRGTGWIPPQLDVNWNQSQTIKPIAPLPGNFASLTGRFNYQEQTNLADGQVSWTISSRQPATPGDEEDETASAWCIRAAVFNAGLATAEAAYSMSKGAGLAALSVAGAPDNDFSGNAFGCWLLLRRAMLAEDNEDTELPDVEEDETVSAWCIRAAVFNAGLATAESAYSMSKGAGLAALSVAGAPNNDFSGNAFGCWLLLRRAMLAEDNENNENNEDTELPTETSSVSIGLLQQGWSILRTANGTAVPMMAYNKRTVNASGRGEPPISPSALQTTAFAGVSILITDYTIDVEQKTWSISGEEA